MINKKIPIMASFCVQLGRAGWGGQGLAVCVYACVRASRGFCWGTKFERLALIPT